ncbi:uncharacterized protein LOC120291506 [Eucalyptus grandis]|uniref:uncharacterized protein LOC120291506 n=1 Tax=Eucalyptus grandis TaxID=71139 RepID=UPI00192F0FF6|nr:uncharacterized protein LOC120291506 [Eucalyptus grandis]
MALNAIGMFKLIPSTLALMAVHRQRATSKSAKPSSNAQHGLDGGVPTTTLTTPPRRSTHAPSFSVSLGHAAGGGDGDGSVHVWQALETVARRRRERMKMGVERAIGTKKGEVFLGLFLEQMRVLSFLWVLG